MTEKAFIDSSVFVSCIVEDDDYGWSKSELSKLTNNPNNNYELWTSHEVLGEVKMAILEVARNDYVQELYDDFLKYYSVDSFFLTTPNNRKFQRNLRKVCSEDSRIDYTDSKIIAQAISEDCDTIYTTDRDWSIKHDIQIKNPE